MNKNSQPPHRKISKFLLILLRRNLLISELNSVQKREKCPRQENDEEKFKMFCKLAKYSFKTAFSEKFRLSL